MKMHDDLMSSMDLSQQMVELTACADINACEKIIVSDNLLENKQDQTSNTNTTHQCDLNQSQNDNSVQDGQNPQDNQLKEEVNMDQTENLTNNDENQKNEELSQGNVNSEQLDGVPPNQNVIQNDINDNINDNIKDNIGDVKQTEENMIEDEKLNENLIQNENENEEKQDEMKQQELCNNKQDEQKLDGKSNDEEMNDESNESKEEFYDCPPGGFIQPPYIPAEDKKLHFTNHLQFIKQVMTKYIFKFRSSVPFQNPVDCITLRIPHYYNIIKSPMDLKTIKLRLDYLWYDNAQQCLSDFKLMFDNCYMFNRPDDYVHQAGKKLEKYIQEKLLGMTNEPEIEIPLPPRPNPKDNKIHQKDSMIMNRSNSTSSNDLSTNQSQHRVVTRSDHGLLAKKPNKDLPEPISGNNPSVQIKKVQLNKSMRYCLDIVKEMMSKKHLDYSWPFLEPVDVNLFPDYLNIIKKPVDLGTIKTKIETGQYRKAESFAKDVRLVFTNCLRYNPPELPIVEMARKLRDCFEFRFAKIPDELLLERMPKTKENKEHRKEHKEKSFQKVHKEEKQLQSPITIAPFHSPVQSGNETRMRILEDQVKLLTDAIGSVLNQKPRMLAAVETSKPKRKRNSNLKRQPSKAKQDLSRKKIKRDMIQADLELSSSDDEDDARSNGAILSSPVPSVETFGYEEMAQLKTDLEQLDADSLRRVLKILQTSEPSIKCDDENELEIDFEVLKPSTLIELRKYVSSCMLNNSSKKSIANGSDDKKNKSKQIQQQQQEQQVEPVKQQKQSCDINPNSNLSHLNTTSQLSESSSSEDDSSSSSDSDDE